MVRSDQEDLKCDRTAEALALAVSWKAITRSNKQESQLFFTTSMGSKCKNDPDMPQVYGEGCLQVGMIVTHKVGRWKVMRNIASGPFSDVFIIADVENSNQKYAMKCERQEGNIRPVLKLDVLVLMSVKGSVGFPLFIAAGRTRTYR
ncbi:hypothetical protein NECAME_13857 [Necator americanus]|uniref:Protein kinase domain-containing protein n=1 Tax=Necator americanus TaxID=51031 RepID=W2SRT9_NECAM|nr:hypothetical protein NECAME_13857 [Necator americanus]ETN72459.1 hypothetical protein NECAME_13857 [Necator americanus]